MLAFTRTARSVGVVMVTLLALLFLDTKASSAAEAPNFHGSNVPLQITAPRGAAFDYPLAWTSNEEYTGNQDIGFILSAPKEFHFSSPTMRAQLSTNGEDFTDSSPTVICTYRNDDTTKMLCDGIIGETWTWSIGTTLRFIVSLQTDARSGPAIQVKGGLVQAKFNSQSPEKETVYLGDTATFDISIEHTEIPLVDPLIGGIAFGAILVIGLTAFMIRRRKTTSEGSIQRWSPHD